MRLEAKKYLHDAKTAADLIFEFTATKQFGDYCRDAMLRAAVERQFEIIGEALAQLSKLDEALVARISGYRRIIAFRNLLIHGYGEVDHRIVWDVVESKLPVLREEIAALVEDA